MNCGLMIEISSSLEVLNLISEYGKNFIGRVTSKISYIIREFKLIEVQYEY